MVQFAEARLAKAHLAYKIPDWDAWMRKLSKKASDLSREHGSFFLHIFHIFEKAYCQDMLEGSQVEIRQLIHKNMMMAHKHASKCDYPACEWISHECKYRGQSQSGECHLLPVRLDSQQPPPGTLDTVAMSPSPRSRGIGYPLWIPGSLRCLIGRSQTSPEEDIEKGEIHENVYLKGDVEVERSQLRVLTESPDVIHQPLGIDVEGLLPGLAVQEPSSGGSHQVEQAP